MNSKRVRNMVFHVVPKHVFRVPNKKSKAAALISFGKVSEEYATLVDGDRMLLRSKTQPAKINRGSIPKGFVAVYVGPEERRFVIPTRLLSAPDFRDVMDRAAEEFGYEQEGGLRIPCDEQDFERILANCFASCKIKVRVLE